MICTNINESRRDYYLRTGSNRNRDQIINNLLESRNIYNTQTISYDIFTVYSTDLDTTGNFLLAGLSNGTVDLYGVQDPNSGALELISVINIGRFQCNRVQWNPSDEQFFSMLDNHNLILVDPVELRAIEKFSFPLITHWSEWNPNDRKLVAVCGAESQVRLVDLSSGSSVQTIILKASSGLASHRTNRCIWSKRDINCLVVGDNEGFLHIYDTRHSTRPLLMAGDEWGQISGMAFTNDQNSIITSQGTENRLFKWDYDRCSLKATKFKKRERLETSLQSGCNKSGLSREREAQTTKQTITTSSKHSKISIRKRLKQVIPLPVDAIIRCQFYITDRHIYCPVPAGTKKSKEIYIYDLKGGDRIKTLKSDDILCQGVYSVAGLLPEALVLYVGGRGRLRVWTLDEEHQIKMDKKMKEYHRTDWDSD